MTVRHRQLDTLQTALEQQCEELTAELTRLTTHRTTPERIGYDRHGLDTQMTATRQALADTAQALRRVAEGTYGRCERCQTEIPVERLEIRPHARNCVPCQQSAMP